MSTTPLPTDNEAFLEIGRALDDSYGSFPFALVDKLRADWPTHRLGFISILAEAVLLPRRVIAANTVLPTFAMFLAAEARDSGAYPLLLGITRLSAEEADGLIQDCVLDGLDRALASTCPGDDAVLRELAVSRALPMQHRLAAMGALVTRACEGDAPREQIAEFLLGVARVETTFVGVRGKARAAADARELVALIVDCLCDLSAAEHWDTIKAWYQSELIDPSYASLDEIETRLFTLPEPGIPHHRYHYIRSVVDEMSDFAMFQEGATRDDTDEVALLDDEVFARALAVFGDVSLGNMRSEPVTRTSPKIGRNEPCPCGSGKKFKKCCENNRP